jgi:hypothetical protein
LNFNAILTQIKAAALILWYSALDMPVLDKVQRAAVWRDSGICGINCPRESDPLNLSQRADR